MSVRKCEKRAHHLNGMTSALCCDHSRLSGSHELGDVCRLCSDRLRAKLDGLHLRGGRGGRKRWDGCIDG